MTPPVGPCGYRKGLLVILTPEEEDIPRMRVSSTAIFGVMAVLGPIFYCLVTLAVHVWTIHLFYRHWGGVWSIVALGTPVLSWIVAMVASFWWGEWNYLLAIAAGLIGLMASGSWLGMVDNWTGKRIGQGVVIAAFVSMLFLVGAIGGFCYFGVRYISSPRPITAETTEELEDMAFAVCAILSRSLSNDPLITAELIKPKAEVRRIINDYGVPAKAEIRRQVNIYVRVQYLLRQTFHNYLEALQSDQDADFPISRQLRDALHELPERLRAEVDGELKIVQKLLTDPQLSESLRGPATDSKPMHCFVAAMDEKYWRIYREVYADLLGTPMPKPQDLGIELTVP